MPLLIGIEVLLTNFLNKVLIKKIVEIKFCPIFTWKMAIKFLGILPELCMDLGEILALRALFSERTRWPHHPNLVWAIPIFETSENDFSLDFLSPGFEQKSASAVTSGTNERLFDKGDDDVRGYWKGWVRSGEYERKIKTKLFRSKGHSFNMTNSVPASIFFSNYSHSCLSKKFGLMQQKQKFSHSRKSNEANGLEISLLKITYYLNRKIP